MSADTPSLFDPAGDPEHHFFLTNRFNLLEILASRLLKPRAGYDDERYYPDLLDLSHGRIPILRGGAHRSLQEHVQAGGPAAFPVLIELNPGKLGAAEVPALSDSGPTRAGLHADAAQEWAPSGPLPLAAATVVHFRTAEECEEHRVRRFDNVPTDLELRVTPKLFEDDRPRAGLLDWLAALDGIETGDLVTPDRVSGAITLVAAALPGEEAAVTLLRDLLTTRQSRRRTKKTEQQMTWLLSLGTGARRGGTLDDRLFEAAVNVFKAEQPARSWRPNETLARVLETLVKKRISTEDRTLIDRHFEGIAAILGNEREFHRFRPATGLTTAKALLLALMRPDPTELLDWPADETGADTETRVTAAALCGLLHGRKRITTSLRTSALDDYLAQQEALEAATAIDSVTLAPQPIQVRRTTESASIQLRPAKTVIYRRELTFTPPSPEAGEPAVEYSTALKFAVDAHAAQSRKGTNFPYVVHPIRVAEILARLGYPSDLVVAGLLHDTLEDTPTRREELLDRFGERVAALVTAVSEPSKLDGSELPRPERMEQTLKHVGSETDVDVLRIIAADKLDNVRSIRDSLRDQGPTATWALFNAPAEAQASYYRGVSDTLIDRQPNEPLFQLLQLEVEAVFPPVRHAATTRFFYAHELWDPEQARPYLADPKTQWKVGRSAYELAHSWISAQGIPQSVRRVLEQVDAFNGCELAEGLFERQVALRTPGRSSQTDLLVLLALKTGHAVVAVEGKAGESFDKLVREWNDSKGKQNRLDALCADIGLDPNLVGELRYQLLHRTASALYEANRYGIRDALMLVHAFAEDPTSFADFQRFAQALGTPVDTKNAMSDATTRGDISLRLAWVQDVPRATSGSLAPMNR